MKMQLVSVLSIFVILNGVKSDSFDNVLNELSRMQEEKNLDDHVHGQDLNAVYNNSAVRYAKIFTEFLGNYENCDEITERFEALSATAWEGHYITKLYLDEKSIDDISLMGTYFHFMHSVAIYQKNLQVIQNIHEILSRWFNEMLDNSAYEAILQAQPKLSIDNIQDLYAVGLFILNDQQEFKEVKIMFKRYGVFFIYLFNTVRRLNDTIRMVKNEAVLKEYRKLVRKYISDQTGTESGYIKSKLKAIKKSLESKTTKEKNGKFIDISNEFIDLYYKIFEKCPSKIDVKSIDKNVNKYMEIYADKKDDANYQTVKDGHRIVMRLFEQKKSGSFSIKLPSMKKSKSSK